MAIVEELEVYKTTFSSSQEKLAHTAVLLYYSNAFLYRETFISFWAVFFYRSADFIWQKPHRLLCCYFWLFWTQLNPHPRGFYMLPHKLPTLEIFSFTTHLINGGQVGTTRFSVWFNISVCLICESREYFLEQKKAIPDQIHQILTLWR